MKWRRFSFVLINLLLFISIGCTSRQDPRTTPVLTVNKQTFTAQDVGKIMAKRLKNYDALAAKDPANIKRAREEVLQELIVSALLTQYASAHKITVSETEENIEFDRVRKSYPDDLTFKAALATEGQTLGEWRDKLTLTLLQRKVFDTLTPKSHDAEKQAQGEAQKYYDTHRAEFTHPAEIHIQQILVANEDDAERLSHKLKAGLSFSELAKKFSIGPEGPEGGDIGYVPKGASPAFDAAFALKPGQISGVVKSSYGFHIIKVLDKRPAGTVPFEEIKTRLMRQVDAQKQQVLFNQWLSAAIKSAKIERNDGLLDRIRIRTEAPEE